MRIYWRKYHPDPEKIIFLSNTEEIHEERLRWGMNSHYVNIGCFIDENIFMPSNEPQDKMYDAVLKAHPRDPGKIRRRYLEKARIFRDRFRDEVLAPVLKRHGVDLTAEDVMRTHPFPWWGESGKEFRFSPL